MNIILSHDCSRLAHGNQVEPHSCLSWFTLTCDFQVLALPTTIGFCFTHSPRTDKVPTIFEIKPRPLQARLNLVHDYQNLSCIGLDVNLIHTVKKHLIFIFGREGDPNSVLWYCVVLNTSVLILHEMNSLVLYMCVCVHVSLMKYFRVLFTVV